MIVIFFVISAGSWAGFWYQIGWGDSWRWALMFLAVNMAAFHAITIGRKQR